MTAAVGQDQRAVDWNIVHPVGSPVLAWPGTRDVEPLRTRTRSGAWTLPSGEAVVMVDGHAGGIALTHVDHDPTRREPPPAIEHRAPLCSLCDTETYYEDGWRCDACGVSWDERGGRATWDEPDALACRATSKPFDNDRLAPEHESIRHSVERCHLPADGHLDHLGSTPWHKWSDGHESARTDETGKEIR
jgi:hypothetical protein